MERFCRETRLWTVIACIAFSALSISVGSVQDTLSPSETPQSTGVIQLRSGTVNIDIPDTGVLTGAYIQASGAPVEAVVTNVKYRLQLSHYPARTDFWCSDYAIWIFADPSNGRLTEERLVWDELGHWLDRHDDGNDDDPEDDLDIYLNWRETSFFDGQSPNQFWGVAVKDNVEEDEGRLEYFEFDIHWEVLAPPEIRIEPTRVSLKCPESASDAAEAWGTAHYPAPGSVPKVNGFEEIFGPFGEDKETTKIIVNLKQPYETMAAMDWNDSNALETLHLETAALEETVLSALSAGQFSLKCKFENQAGFAGEATLKGLSEILDHPLVECVEPDRVYEAHLAQGIPLMNASTVRRTHNGVGVAIAICDTGVDYTHPRLGGGGFPNAKVIGGIDTGDGDADPIHRGHPHGTACAGIAAGDLGVSGDYIGGVAHNAKIYAIKISTGTGGSARESAFVAAWDWCVTHKNDDPNNPLLIISTSFGGGKFSSVCDGASTVFATSAANCIAAGITPFVSSGNDGFCDSVGWPSCVSNVISVGAVYDAAFTTQQLGWCVDATACSPTKRSDSANCPSTGYSAWDIPAADMLTSYSNTYSLLGLLAPSNHAYTADIVGPGGYSSTDYTATFGGTSAACPYAAGAAAALQSASKALTGQYLTPAELQSTLISTGDIVADWRIPSIQKPRVNLQAAVDTIPSGNIVSSSFTIYNDGGGPLRVTSIYAQNRAPWLDWSPKAPFTVRRGGSKEVTVRVRCNLVPGGEGGAAAETDATERLVISSDDDDESPYPVGVNVDVSFIQTQVGGHWRLLD